jgi:MGT family glycosyltransferase
MERSSEFLPRKILFAHWDGGGTNPPVLAIVRRMVERGHEVRVLVHRSLEAEVQKTGATFVSWSGNVLPIQNQARSELPHQEEPKRANNALARVRSGFARLREQARLRTRLKTLIAGDGAQMIANFCADSLTYARVVLAELDRQPADAVVVTDMLFGAMAAAEKVQLPFAVLAPNIYFYPAPGVPPFGPGFLPTKGPVGRIRDAMIQNLNKRTLALGLPALNAARTQIGLDSLRDPCEQVERATRVLVLTSTSFDFAAERRPESVVYVGPQLEDPLWSQAWREEQSEGERTPLILVGLSTTFQDQGPVLQRVLNALGSLPVVGVATTGPALDPDKFDVPKNTTLYRSLAHSQVLPRASLTITHAGHGTVIRSLAHGVPLLCLPMGRDQNDNAARVVARGVGKRLRQSASTAAIRKAIRQVLENPAYRESARRLGATIRRDAQDSAVVAILEEVATERAAHSNRRSASVGR